MLQLSPGLIQAPNADSKQSFYKRATFALYESDFLLIVLNWCELKLMKYRYHN